MLKTH